jgi:required for meiotic nuclear division protein 1
MGNGGGGRIPTIDNRMESPFAIQRTEFNARAVLYAERIDLRGLSGTDALATNPLTVEVRGGGMAVLFRYGVVVFFDVAAMEELAFLGQLGAYAAHPYPTPETEAVRVRVEVQAREGGVQGGAVVLETANLERLQVIADVLSKSVLLALYESQVASEFDRIEPLAAELERSGRIPGQTKTLLSKIGAMLLVSQRMVGRAAITDKPELLWDHPALEGLFGRLEDEYEIIERHEALERKLKLISSTVQTLLEMLSSRHSLRVEWYIVFLIVVEILLTLYELFLHR